MEPLPIFTGPTSKSSFSGLLQRSLGLFDIETVIGETARVHMSQPAYAATGSLFDFSGCFFR